MPDGKFDVTRGEALGLYSKMVLTRLTEAKHDELLARRAVPEAGAAGLHPLEPRPRSRWLWSRTFPWEG
jgi:hypothetical protein